MTTNSLKDSPAFRTSSCVVKSAPAYNTTPFVSSFSVYRCLTAAARPKNRSRAAGSGSSNYILPHYILHKNRSRAAGSGSSNHILPHHVKIEATPQAAARPNEQSSNGSLLIRGFPRLERKQGFFLSSASPVFICLQRRANSDSSPVHKLPVITK